MTENRITATPLSIYGYGMLSFCAAMSLLIAKGIFTNPHYDPVLVWGAAIFAGASGALALAIVRTYFPAAQAIEAVFITTFFAIYLFGCFFTSYYGYSILYLIKVNPEILENGALTDFWHTLGTIWLETCAAAAACSLAYLLIFRAMGNFSPLMPGKQ